MTEVQDWNTKIVDEFRANEGRVGGPFEGAPMVLLHTRGRRSGREHVNPLMYLPAEDDGDAVYVFASKAGAPSDPDWYRNLVSAGEATVEIGTETSRVTVQRAPRGRARPHLRRTGPSLPRLRRVRGEDQGRPHDPGARAATRLTTAEAASARCCATTRVTGDGDGG